LGAEIDRTVVIELLLLELAAVGLEVVESPLENHGGFVLLLVEVGH